MNTALHRRLPLLFTAGIFVLLFTISGTQYKNFFSTHNLVNILSDASVLGIFAVGLTLVIFAGGIDLSVGAVAGFTTIFVANLVENHGIHPMWAALAALALGTAFGAAMGTIIHVFKQPAFLVTLAGLFFARGCAFWISTESIEIQNPFYKMFIDFTSPLGADDLWHPFPAAVMLAVFLAGGVLAHYTRFGRNLLAIGGNEQSALLMGLPVGVAKISAYALCGACAALGGLVNTLYTGSGNSSFGIGLELDAIAVVVVGGTLLTGGRGHMAGTFCGILILGTIKSAIIFDGRLNSAWMRIIIGLLLLGFILLQRLLLRATRKTAS